MEELDHKWLGPVKAYCLFHIFDNPLFWLGIVVLAFFGNEGFASGFYNMVENNIIGTWFKAAYEWATQHSAGWWGTLFVGLSIVASFIRYQVTRFVIEKGVLVVTRGKFSLNPFSFFQRLDYTVALNLIYDVDVKKTIFQYVFGGGDIFIRTASNDVFHLEFIEDPHALREYLIEHSGIKNKPVIGIY